MLIFRITINQKIYSTYEINQLMHIKRLYARHLQTVMGESSPFDMQKNNTPKPINVSGMEQAMAGQLTGSLGLIARSISVQLENYLTKRKARYFNAGYANDPITLLCQWLETQIYPLLQRDRCTPTHIKKLHAIMHFLQAIDYENVFAQEPLNAHGMIALIHHLVNTLETAVQGVKAVLYTQCTREKLQKVRDAQVIIMEKSLHYLYFIVSNVKDRHGVMGNKFSAISFFTHPYFEDRALRKTFLGRVFEKLIYDKQVCRMLLNLRQGDAPLSVLPARWQGGTPLLDDQPPVKKTHRPLQGLFPIKNRQAYLKLKSHLSSDRSSQGKRINAVPSGVYYACDQDIKLMMDFLYLHDLTKALAHFHHYTRVFWELSGLGGDALILVEMGEMITEFFEIQRQFYVTFLARFQAFHQKVRHYYNKNIAEIMTATTWPKHYREKRQWRAHVSYSMAALTALEEAVLHACAQMQNMITAVKAQRDKPEDLSQAGQTLLQSLHTLPAFLRQHAQQLTLPDTLECESFMQRHRGESKIRLKLTHKKKKKSQVSPPVIKKISQALLPEKARTCLSESLWVLQSVVSNDYRTWRPRIFLYLGFNARYDYLLGDRVPCGQKRLAALVQRIDKVIQSGVYPPLDRLNALLADLRLEHYYVQQAQHRLRWWFCRWFQSQTRHFFGTLQRSLASQLRVWQAAPSCAVTASDLSVPVKGQCLREHSGRLTSEKPCGVLGQSGVDRADRLKRGHKSENE